MGHSMNDAVEMEMDAVYGKGEREVETVQTGTYLMARLQEAQDPLDPNRILYVVTVGDALEAYDREREGIIDVGDPAGPEFDSLSREARINIISKCMSAIDGWVSGLATVDEALAETIHRAARNAAAKGETEPARDANWYDRGAQAHWHDPHGNMIVNEEHAMEAHPDAEFCASGPCEAERAKVDESDEECTADKCCCPPSEPCPVHGCEMEACSCPTSCNA